MLGYICDRCKKFDPGVDSQKEGLMLSPGWTWLVIGALRMHLCSECADEVLTFMKK